MHTPKKIHLRKDKNMIIQKVEATQAPQVPPETEQQPLAFARVCQANSCGETKTERLLAS